MKRNVWTPIALLALLLSTGCAENAVTQPVRSLDNSGEVSTFCATSNAGKLVGLPADACPDPADRSKHMLALVTQTGRGEVALVDLSVDEEEAVIDVNPSVPGKSFLPVGELPVDVVTTPGGTASFVAVAAAGRPGIFALPTSCLGPPLPGELARDLTSWPACALPSAPADMTVLLGSADDDASCGNAQAEPAVVGGECSVDLTAEQGSTGVRKLAVTLPERGTVAIIDAQWLLNQTPGSFNDCRFVEHPLGVDLPSAGLDPALPPDLQAPQCLPIEATPASGPFTPFPTQQALGQGDTVLYIADRKAPVIHALDVRNPCQPVPQPPLLPSSLTEPERVVTTTGIAVSPRTTLGQRFLYAIDDRQSVLAFDVTPGTGSRLPIVRAGSPRIPSEEPDRITLSPARAVSFAFRDDPNIDPDTGIAVFGEKCDPDPRVGTDETTAARHRPAADLSTGAGPTNLRGTFGFIALTNGEVAVVDVEDLDAACRRPVSSNAGPEPDFRGCANDPPDIPQYTRGGTPTVSNEVSCNVVQPHRLRSAFYAVTSSQVGVRAPSLRSLPQLTSLNGGQRTDNSADGRANPKLLAVAPNAQRAAEVFVGTTLFSSSASDAELRLELNPSTAVRSSLTLPLEEPRSYASDEDYAVTFEGRVAADLAAGRWLPADADSVDNPGQIVLQQTASFCDLGVEDTRLMRDQGERLGVRELDAFARQHADYVQITTPLLSRDDDYWDTALGSTCGGGSTSELRGYEACEALFGQHDDKVLDTRRDLRVLEAYDTHLVLEPRDTDTGRPEGVPEEAVRRTEMLRCCFPTAGNTYNVRAGRQWIVRGSRSGFRHDVRADESSTGARFAKQCVRDCDPLKRYFRARAFEISSTTPCPPVPPEAPDARGCIGASTAQDYACKVTANDTAIASDSACVFENLNARFAIYRGGSPTERDATFAWQVAGGFVPLTASIAEETTSVSPRSMLYVPQLGQLAVVDGNAAGLTLISLSDVSVAKLIF